MRLEVFSQASESNHPLLILNWLKDHTEEMIFFSSPTSEHIARMNILDDAIIVEHDVALAQTGTFARDERALAIKFIECLFAFFSYDKEYLSSSYQEGVDAFFSGICISKSPYYHHNNDCHQMWVKGFENAREKHLNEV